VIKNKQQRKIITNLSGLVRQNAQYILLFILLLTVLFECSHATR